MVSVFVAEKVLPAGIWKLSQLLQRRQTCFLLILNDPSELKLCSKEKVKKLQGEDLLQAFWQPIMPGSVVKEFLLRGSKTVLAKSESKVRSKFEGSASVKGSVRGSQVPTQRQLISENKSGRKLSQPRGPAENKFLI